MTSETSGLNLNGADDSESEEELSTVVDENEDDVTETISERLWGLTEMLPDPVWDALRKSRVWSVWFVRRASWVVGVSVALLMLPIATEQQRLELEEMQNMQKRQVMLGPGSGLSPSLGGVRPPVSGRPPS
ncbi:mitochondrial import receptor subunit TOM22 homolog [Dysidea avara]|uniref:mitochondrial import receptor subunit TOM22 homolog n=1 Tax=Dysidea avara TaxID=196820 RepID=UPI0033176024